jgi:hypothetical protein
MPSARVAIPVLASAILSATSALAGPYFDDKRIDEAQRALDAAKAADADSADGASYVRAAVAAGLGPARVRSLLAGAVAPCLAQALRCKINSNSSAAIETVESLIGLLGELGDKSDLALLLRLEQRGFTQASIAHDRILARDLAHAVAASRCAPPSDAEIARARADLDDFAVIYATRAGLEAAAPTPRQRDDLAYFFAAVSGSGPEVGAAPDDEPGGRVDVKRDAARDALQARLERAKLDGDHGAIARAARAYLASFGYPGKSSFGSETRFAWGGAQYSFVMRDLADAAEASGLFREAAALYRRADPGGGMCGTSVEYIREEQAQGVIRSEERAGQCRAAIPERLLAYGGDYGPDRLARAGFDVARLYRGALVTLNRDVPREQLREALARAPAAIRDRALARLTKRGPEDWERRVHAAEGLADAGQRAAMRPLLDAITAGSAPVRARAISALGELAERPVPDPCAPRDGWSSSFSSSNSYHRDVRSLGRACATKLLPATSDALARALLPYLDASDIDTRVAAVEALGRIGSSLAAPAILRLTSDPYTTPGVTRCTSSSDEARNSQNVCGPIYPVREAAEEASKLLGGPGGAYVPRLVVAARPRPATRF